MKSYVSPEYKTTLGELATFLMSQKLGQTAAQPTVQLSFPPTLKLRQPVEMGWEQTDEASGA